MNYVSKENMSDILDGIARKIGQGGSGTGLEDWQAEKEYTYNDICVYEGQIYRAKVGFTSDTTFSTTQILEEYEPVGGETIIPYEKDTEISINDIVSYDNNTYKAVYNFVCGEEFTLFALQEYVPQELTDDDIKEIVEAYNPVVEETKGVEYSTEERRIGTWIDGKPLYQKTYNLTAPSIANTSVELDTIPVDTTAGNIADMQCIVRDISSITGTYPLYNIGEELFFVWIRSSGAITCRVSTLFLNKNVLVTIKYTKTTDGDGGGT